MLRGKLESSARVQPLSQLIGSLSYSIEFVESSLAVTSAIHCSDRITDASSRHAVVLSFHHVPSAARVV